MELTAPASLCADSNQSLSSGTASTPVEPSLVLIVDDDPAFSYLCAGFIEAAVAGSYSAVEVGTIDQALHALRSQWFDCLVVDYGLPDGTGADLIEKVRHQFPDWPGATVLMTAEGSEEIVTAGMRAGADDYISKQSINAQSIDRTLRSVFEKLELRKELLKKNSLLEKRNEEITDFYHKVSHEIKTPLTAARLFMSMLDEEIAGALTGEQSELVTQALASCDELTKHFNDLIECTRLEAHKISLAYSEEQLRRLVDRSVASLVAAAVDKSIELEVRCDSALPTVLVDAGRIVQVLANLIGNAVKFTDPGGKVSVSARQSGEAGDWIEVRVADTGIGIKEEHLPRIYERLYQVGSYGNASTGAGLGLGLSITREIVALHGGDITVQSKYGEGTVFTVLLPMQPDLTDTHEVN